MVNRSSLCLMALGLMAILLTPSLLLAGDSQTAGSAPAWWLIIVFVLHAIVTWLFSQGRYLVQKQGELQSMFSELQEFSFFLLAGTIIAQLWVHGDPDSYAATIHASLSSVTAFDMNVTLHFLVNDVFMALFFGIAAKELVEATTKEDGPLRGTNGFLPMMACIGGVIGPAIVFRFLCTPEMSSAWAVPCSTDIAFAWLGARIIWGHSHPAVTFLLAVSVADDLLGMGIIAIWYPQRPFSWPAMSLLAAGVAVAFIMSRLARRTHVFRNWPLYFVPGVMCWLGLYFAGLHAALALVFVVPFIPMSGRDQGIFAEERPRIIQALSPRRMVGGNPGHLKNHERMDPLNRFEFAVRPFVDIGLFFFGLANAGVAWAGSSVWDQNSWAVFLGLGIGKTVGIITMTIIGYSLMRTVGGRAELPFEKETEQSMTWRDLPIIALFGAMGFTVALFIADAAGAHDSLKLGAIASFSYLGLGILVGRLWIRREIYQTENAEVHPRDDVE